MNANEFTILYEAIAAADGIDPTGRLRAILHVLRCGMDARTLPEVLSARTDGFYDNLDSATQALRALGREEAPPAQALGALLLDHQVIWLDADGVEELTLYLMRRRKQTRHLLSRYDSRGGKFYLVVVSGGGRVARSLGTTNRDKAAMRIRHKRKHMREIARANDAGWLFPHTWRPTSPMKETTVRGWLSGVVGKRASAASHKRCATHQPAWRGGRRRKAKEKLS